MSRFQRRLCAARTLGAPQPRRLRSAGELENRLFTGRARPGAGSPARRWVALPARPGAAGGAHLTRLRRAGRGAAAGRAGARGGLLGCPRPPDPAVRLMSRAGADQPEPLCSGARGLALFLTPEPGSEAKEVEEAIKGMLLRLEEICSRAGMVSAARRSMVSAGHARPCLSFWGSHLGGDLPASRSGASASDQERHFADLGGKHPSPSGQGGGHAGVCARVDQLG
ncbi:breast carcinoma-amplified sequence 4 isoform X3 [Pipistrellus kuhlii]|uniref:breast carcinoma-amplified sequence 4 isoform X3 n=1 Tax=Pipistrellus kuhlii TaxID=59472 RepID=UPI001E26EE7A|nr:breast carcinoma-amplified sequence 4 isoform X3 [Pipistrellus kuhlii]